MECGDGSVVIVVCVCGRSVVMAGSVVMVV